MSETLSLSSGVPGRYATALFNLFREEGQLKVLAKDVSKLAELIDVSNDFKKMIDSPIIKREEQAKAVNLGAVLARVSFSFAKLGAATSRFQGGSVSSDDKKSFESFCKAKVREQLYKLTEK